MQECQAAIHALSIALVEERAYNLRMKAALRQTPLSDPVLDIAKAELKEQFKRYPGVMF